MNGMLMLQSAAPAFCFTAQYASPELLPHLGELECPHMADLPNELWAIGAMVAQVFACATPGWREPFPLTDQEKRAVMHWALVLTSQLRWQK